MKKAFLFIILLSLILVAFRSVKNMEFLPAHFPEPVYNFSSNPYSGAKSELGRILFYDVMLSKNNTISCASCHSNYNAFSHTDHALSHGIYDSIGSRNAPALFNLAWQKTFMWDGAINHLDMVALAPIHNKIEMDEQIENVVNKLQRSALYPPLFYKAFNDSVITGQHTLKAISTFLLTLISAGSKYDSVKNGLSQFTSQEKNGYHLFTVHCASCHTEPLFTNNHFEHNGLKKDPALNDQGRMNITKSELDSLKFKVPTLRNIEFTFPYMHDGRFRTLKDVLEHYTSAIMKGPTLSGFLQDGIKLSSDEKVDLIAFLLTLSDKNFIFSTKHAFPRDALIQAKNQH